MHQTTGRWRLGLLLSLTTVSMWGVLPIVLKLLLAHMDAATINWYRFLIAAPVVGIYLGASARFPTMKSLSINARWLLLIAVVGLAGSYLLFLLSLNLVSPGTAQVVIQLAPIMLMAGGLLFFGERFKLMQWVGVLVLALGLGLFFNHRLVEMFSGLGTQTSGVLMVVAASASWAAYALAQKQLLRHLTSNQVMFLLYCASDAAVLALGASFGNIRIERFCAGSFVAGLHQYPGRLWRFCRSAESLAGDQGQRDTGDYAPADPVFCRTLQPLVSRPAGQRRPWGAGPDRRHPGGRRFDRNRDGWSSEQHEKNAAEASQPGKLKRWQPCLNTTRVLAAVCRGSR